MAFREQSTGSLAVGFGYSSIDKSSFLLESMRRTFWALEGLSVFCISFRKKSNFNLSLTDPFFLDRNLSASANIFTSKLEGKSVTTDQQGIGFGLGFRAANDVYHRLTYNLTEIRLIRQRTIRISTGESSEKLVSSAIGYRLGIEKEIIASIHQTVTLQKFQKPILVLVGM
ncbi:MAG: hypothetical protein CM15mP117_21540 [Alphaproteobacteria bacterium]|nr:MAG: hypothetical protein CM15mP117_21540 [Alphaproteobacteria bacterium]